MNNLFINWWQEEINEVNNSHITLNRLSEAGRTGREELGEWILSVRLRAQGITKGQLPLSHLLTVVTFFLIYPPRTRDLQRCPESTVWSIYVFGDGGNCVEIPALLFHWLLLWRAGQTLLALTYGSRGWGPSQPPSSMELVMQLRNVLGSACVLRVGGRGFPSGNHRMLSSAFG